MATGPGCDSLAAGVGEMVLIRRGAEADLYLEEWYGIKVIRKMRKAKAYRLSSLDLKIRSERTSHEAQIMHDAKLAGVSTPTIYFVDLEATTIFMEYIDGSRVKDVLNELSSGERRMLCERLGCFIGRLHRKGIIHGDLTTSNIILDGKGRVFFIDFGLAEYSEELEKRGVDLLLIKRALQSAHYNYARDAFAAIIDGYAKEIGRALSKDVVDRVSEIEKRGRYAIEK